jgi:pyruvate dehydrogenase E1 component
MFMSSRPSRLRNFAANEAPLPVPALSVPSGEVISTQEGFGKAMIELAKTGGALAERMVSPHPTSPC